MHLRLRKEERVVEVLWLVMQLVGPRFCFASALTLSVSESKVASVLPHAAESFSVGLIQACGNASEMKWEAAMGALRVAI
ncbi:hypothetical protein VNO78_09505 [Psophocarpus tetragonolobus]|uniref:Uncharacterized protein n=1 Tax=Psophocarpus tetragonolobus TaxID=3891 RepID=A0AAN9SXK6_PSOTE